MGRAQPRHVRHLGLRRDDGEGGAIAVELQQREAGPAGGHGTEAVITPGHAGARAPEMRHASRDRRAVLVQVARDDQGQPLIAKRPRQPLAAGGWPVVLAVRIGRAAPEQRLVREERDGAAARAAPSSQIQASTSSGRPVPSSCAFTPGKRDTLVELFEHEFIGSQEAYGIRVIGQFLDLDGPERFVWLRGFQNMGARAAALSARSWRC